MGRKLNYLWNNFSSLSVLCTILASRNNKKRLLFSVCDNVFMKIRPKHSLQLFHCTRARRGLNQTLNYPCHAYAFFYSLFYIRHRVWCLYRMIHLKPNPGKSLTSETLTSAPQNMVKRTQYNEEHFTMFSEQSHTFYVQRDVSYSIYYYFCPILNRSHCSCGM